MPARIQRCLLLFRAAEGADAEAQRDAVLTAIEAIRDSSNGLTADAWVEIDDDPLGRTLPADPYAAVIRIDTEQGPDTLTDAVEHLQAALGPALDLSRSAAVAGELHTVDPGEGSLRLLFCMKAKAGMSLTEFHEYWLHEHAVHHAHRNGLGYRQLHADQVLSERIATLVGVSEADYAGVAEAVLESTAGMGGRSDRGDRVNFVDEASEAGMVLRRLG